jgi:3-mercaptopropionate dioxygenase
MNSTNGTDEDCEEEYFLDNPSIYSFVETVDEMADRNEAIPDLLEELHEPFRDLLMDDEWLPEMYRELPPEEYDDKGHMGDDIAQWLLYRRDEKLALFSLVIPPRHETPVHDHLSWGLVGLYQGTQHEEFYRRLDDNDVDEGHAKLELVHEQEQARGDFYELVPPEGDIHSVRTTSDVPSVSIHLLGADVGCIPRHAFDPKADFVRQFQSGYTNVACETDIMTNNDEGGVDHHHHPSQSHSYDLL